MKLFQKIKKKEKIEEKFETNKTNDKRMEIS